MSVIICILDFYTFVNATKWTLLILISFYWTWGFGAFSPEIKNVKITYPYVHRIFNLMSYITLFFINIDNFQIIYPYISTLSNIESAHWRFRSVSSVEHLSNQQRKTIWKIKTKIALSYRHLLYIKKYVKTFY